MRRSSSPFVLCVFAVSACAEVSSSTRPVQPPAIETPATVLRVFHDDFEGAKAAARSTGTLLVSDAWAPWCHTCISMQQLVLTPEGLAPVAGKVTLVEMDTDKASSADFVARYPVAAWPTFTAIDPHDGTMLAQWVGAASTQAFVGFIERSLLLLSQKRAGALPPVEGQLAIAREAEVQKRYPDAASLYEEIAKVAPDRASEALLGAIRNHFKAGAFEACATLARPAGEASDFAAYLSYCADALPDGPLRRDARTWARTSIQQAAQAPRAGASVDDQVDLLMLLSELEASMGEPSHASATRKRALALIEQDINAAPSRAPIHDYLRSRLLLAEARGEEAVAILRARTAEQPHNYEPFARLADALAKLERFNEALETYRAAIARSYGPRKLRYMQAQADMLEKLGRRDEATAVLRETLQGWRALPPSQRDERREAALVQRLAGKP